MFDVLIHSVGGIGLFLLGMLIMTDALKALAGKRLHRFLSRWTTNTLSGVATGTLSTAVLQSSSATTVAAVGFVGAGLISFEQSLGIIFGANLGTTVTGWLVALFGLKLDIGSFSSVLVFIGAVLRIAARGGTAAGGQALAGFGLIFAGIEVLQSGLAGFNDTLLPETFPEDSFAGRLMLVGLGVLITLITQSSSAGVAAALTAVHTGTLPLTQAAAMIIGMDIGTTFSAFLATIGGSSMARRTGYAHVVYNVITALIALLLLGPFLQLWSGATAGSRLGSPEFSLVAFHSFFNLTGIILIVPFAHLFAQLLRRLVPTSDTVGESRLDASIRAVPALAWPAITGQVERYAAHVVESAKRALAASQPIAEDEAATLARHGDALQQEILCIPPGEADTTAEDAATTQPTVHALRVLDHLDRLAERYDEDRLPAGPELTPAARELRDRLASAMAEWRGALEGGRYQELTAAFEALWREMELQRHELRTRIMQASARGEIDSQCADASLDTVRWVRRNAYHLWRASRYLQTLKDGCLGASA